MKEQEEESKKVIRTFGLASFLNDLGSDIIYPVWPLFVTTILKANMAALGLLDGIGEALVSISKAGSGFLSDRIRRRKIFIYTGYIMGALSRIGYSISTVWTHLIPFRVLDRAGKIRSAPRDAIVADVTTTENRGKSFGFLRAMDHLGAVCLIFILSRSHLMIIISFVLYGAHKAALEPVQRTCVAELSPTEFRASCLGGFQMVTGLCAFPASFVAGILWESFGMVIPFYFSLILTAMSGILLLFVRRIRQEENLSFCKENKNSD